jgi:hypothetical protein
MITSTARPARGDAADYYFKYIDLVPDGDVCDILESQRAETVAFFQSIPEARSSHKYASGKWSIREVLAHLNDCERLFAFRAFWFARGFDSPLPSFDQEVAAVHAPAEGRPLKSHIEEFESVRASTRDFFRHLSPDAWLRRGIASENPFTVRALAYIGAGHVIHHTQIIKERYL